MHDGARFEGTTLAICLVILSFGIPGFGARCKSQFGSTSPSESCRAASHSHNNLSTILCSKPGSRQHRGMADARPPSVQPWGTMHCHGVEISLLEAVCIYLQTKIDVLLKSYCKKKLVNKIHTIEPTSIPSFKIALLITTRAKSNTLHSKGVCYIIYSDQ